MPSTPTLMAAAATPSARRQRLWLLAVLSVLLGFASISTDLYLPAMPTMAAELGAGEGTLQWTISGYLAGFALGQLFWGPLSDRYGRRSGGPRRPGLRDRLGWMRPLDRRGADRRMACSASARRQCRGRLGPRNGARPLRSRRSGEAAFHADDRDGRCSAARTDCWSPDPAACLVAGDLLDAGRDRPADGGGDSHSAGDLARQQARHRRARPGARRVCRPLRQPGLCRLRRTIGFYFAGLFASIAGTPFAYINYHHLSPDSTRFSSRPAWSV